MMRNTVNSHVRGCVSWSCEDTIVSLYESGRTAHGCPWEGRVSVVVSIAVHVCLLRYLLFAVAVGAFCVCFRCRHCHLCSCLLSYCRIYDGTVAVSARGSQFPPRHPLPLLRLLPGCGLPSCFTRLCASACLSRPSGASVALGIGQRPILA